MKLISINQVCELTSLSRTAINKHRANGNFPHEVRVSDSRLAFVEAEIHEWIQARINDRTERASA